jgi:hypothetical protein
MIEAMVGLAIVTMLFIAVWFHYAHNREIWMRGRDKVLLQQALTQAAEAIGRDARVGAGVTLNSATDISIQDRDGNLIRRYYRDAGTERLVTAGGEPVVPEKCAAVSFTVTPDSTEIRFVLTLEDPWLNQARMRGAAHLRNLSED